jgi:hypothetical protein
MLLLVPAVSLPTPTGNPTGQWSGVAGCSAFALAAGNSSVINKKLIALLATGFIE